MPQWAGSSWYFLRYMDPHNDKALASQEALQYWGQVDWYNGGMEHTTLHLLYSRFWHKFLYDLGVVPMRSLSQADQPWDDPGRGRREDVQVRGTWSTPTTWLPSTARTPCGCISCSSGTLRRRPLGLTTR